ncbi:hypothetical protein ASPWEDRAFT_589041 [Aspergillus wentii DTO 134E9]|uniref:Uncharacterized protein n=1 Tax=Aspergillus wentii DTO 134E9 TaxID=1073089 RepID=A0A1L9RCL9_ASPWE|nr:uncharacterized protein ASPWEDRAFT_589041 [Aspergillus wentii DTO 134E9]OJJ32666.1 hypothetical protein ASPWEDRAFT_589041 [Aspergillus wentii DTO 134E9]
MRGYQQGSEDNDDMHWKNIPPCDSMSRHINSQPSSPHHLYSLSGFIFDNLIMSLFPRTHLPLPISRLQHGLIQRSCHTTTQSILNRSFSSKCHLSYNNNTTTHKQSDQPPSRPTTSSPDNEVFASLSFEALGINKNTKIFIFIVFGILGTIETVFWCQTIWRWWKRNSTEGEELD